MKRLLAVDPAADAGEGPPGRPVAASVLPDHAHERREVGAEADKGAGEKSNADSPFLTSPVSSTWA